MTRLSLKICALSFLLVEMGGAAQANDKLTVASGGRGNWDSAAVELGTRAGTFQRQGLDLDVLWTAGSGESQQAVIAGAVDVGITIGTGSAMAAYAKGAPLRIIGAVTTGAKDIFYYVPAGSKISSFKDVSDTTTVAYSSEGSSTFLLAKGLLKHYGRTGKPTRTGDPKSTLTQVMSGQIDIGYATAPFALQDVESGKIRVIAKAGELPGTQDQTVRVIVANAETLRKNSDVIRKFMKAYGETIDWMYNDPTALEMYREFSGVPISVTKKAMSEFFDREMLDPFRVTGLNTVMADAVELKLLSAPLSTDQLSDLVKVFR